MPNLVARVPHLVARSGRLVAKLVSEIPWLVGGRGDETYARDCRERPRRERGASSKAKGKQKIFLRIFKSSLNIPKMINGMGTQNMERKRKKGERILTSYF